MSNFWMGIALALIGYGAYQISAELADRALAHILPDPVPTFIGQHFAQIHVWGVVDEHA